MTGCDCCAQRAGHVYHVGCDRCEARMLARGATHQEIERMAGMTPELRALIEEERERDGMGDMYA